jgi:hypothetical protein
MSDTESETDSLGPMPETETRIDSTEDQNHIQEIRSAVREWKTRELYKNTAPNSNAKGHDALTKYIANAAQLFFDLISYIKTSQNKEQNMRDSLYVKIVGAIGNPGALSHPLLMNLELLLSRDLIELPYTLEPKMTNAFAKEGIQAQKEFPEEE